MPEIVITIRNKVATASVRSIVCDNTDYTVRLDCDAQWGDGPKIVYFVLQGVGALAPATTADDVCAVPPIHLSDGVGRQLAIGVQQGAVKTSSAAHVFCWPSAENELIQGIIEDDDITLTWLEWVNANMAQAAENVQTAETVLAAAQAAQTAAETAANSAGGSANDAAIDAASASSAAFMASAQRDLAINARRDAEAWAKGTKDGEDVGSDDPAYHSNAKYYAEQADGSAANAAGSASTASGAAQNATTKASEAASSASAAQAAQTAAETAANSAGGSANSAAIDAADAGESFMMAARMRDAAIDASRDAEAWAKGTKNGENVESDDPAYHSNAKYYAEQAGTSAAAAAASAASAETNAAAASESATMASGAASTATTKAGEAATSAESASGSATTASGAASTATTKAEEAAASAEAAAASALTLTIDNTLSQSGQAADAKATGDAVVDLKDELLPVDLAEGVTTTSGKYINYSTGTEGSSSSAFCTDLIDLTGITAIVYSRYYTTSSSSNWGIAFYDTNGSFIEDSGIRAALGNSTAHYELESADVPSGAKYVRLSGNSTLGPVSLYDKASYDTKVYPRLDGLDDDINGIETDIEKINAALLGETFSTAEGLTSGKLYLASNQAIGQTPSLSTNGNGSYTIIDIAYAAGGVIELEMDTVGSNANTVSMFCDSENKIVYTATTSGNWLPTFDSEKNRYVGQKTIPSGVKWLYFSVYQGSSTLYLNITPRALKDGSSVRYVATTGSDDNEGKTSSAALATVNKALELGADTVIIAPGVYEQKIDLSGAGSTLKIVSGSSFASTVFKAPNSLIAESAALVSGYTKVYSCSSDKSYSDARYIWQEGVPDASTEISASESHPLQRGKTHRCDEETAIAKCSANSVSDALTEIEGADDYRFYYDSTNQVLYFSSPHEVTADYALRGSFSSTSLFRNVPRGLKLSMMGISVKYMAVRIEGASGFELSDCSCGNVYGPGAFAWDLTLNAKFVRCEAYRTYYTSSTGDGFNGHGNNPSTIDQHVKETTCTLVDCWAHDNVDDGYSDHEHCEITVIGGLYEYNGSGVTPAAGSNCTCYNAYARFNRTDADFYYTSSENAVGGRFACYGCISEGDGTGKGFVINSGQNRAMFYDCIVINRAKGFASENPNRGGSQVVRLINCTTQNVPAEYVRESHMIVISGTAVS